MKKAKIFLVLILIISLLYITTSCSTETHTAVAIAFIIAFFSYPTVYITDANGGSNFSNPNNPISGTSITNATVTATNETTGSSMTLPYVSSSIRGYYQPTSNFSHNAGEKVSLLVQTPSGNITGNPTITPDPVYSNLSPSSTSNVTLPFTISWSVSQGTYSASHTWVYIYDSNLWTDETKYYQETVPISQTSLKITSANIPAGIYTIGVFGVNTMSFSSSAKSGSIGYVDGAGTRAIAASVTVQ